MISALEEVRSHTVREPGGLADIDHVARLVLEEIDARLIRQVSQFGFKGGSHRQWSTAVGMATRHCSNNSLRVTIGGPCAGVDVPANAPGCEGLLLLTVD